MKKILVLLISVFFLSFFATAEKSENRIVIDKRHLQLYVINQMDTLFQAPICCGKVLGNKTRSGDCKTPEGTFTISNIHDSREWIYYPKYGKKRAGVKGCYGPWFFRIKTPKWNSIGIHGTRVPSSIGTRASEGCIRLTNENVLKLKPLVFVGMEVTILPD